MLVVGNLQINYSYLCKEITRTNMIINTARFVISNSDYRKCPTDQRHEYAFIGRSNVGKSSLINMLTGRKGLIVFIQNTQHHFRCSSPAICK